MKKIIQYIGILTTIFVVASCKDFLDQPTPGKFPEADYFKTDDDANGAVIGVYDQLSNSYNSVWTSMYLFKMMPSDESNAAGADPTDQQGYQELDDFKHGSDNSYVRDVWAATYRTIMRANKAINKIAPDNALRQRLIAEAKVIRAHAYLDLVSLWGDIPLMLADNITPAEFKNFPRVPKAEVYAQIEKDLQEAIPALPLKGEYSNADKFRVSKGTAQGLLGKALLYQEKWAPALTALQSVITSGQYGLESTVGAAFSRQAEFGKESLFELSYTTENGNTWGNYAWTNSLENNIIVQLMGPREGVYKAAPGDSLIQGWGFNVPTKKLYDAFIASGEQESTRRWATVFSIEELKEKGGNFSEPNRYDFEGFLQRKYASYGSQAGTNGDQPLNYGTNFRLLRYADVLLMAAEAAYRSGGDAATYINEVRNRSGLGDVSATGDDMFQAIVRERELELAMEGHRFVDLVRWGLAAQELGSRGFQAGKNEVMPIPTSDILNGGLTQNTGY